MQSPERRRRTHGPAVVLPAASPSDPLIRKAVLAALLLHLLVLAAVFPSREPFAPRRPVIACPVIDFRLPRMPRPPRPPKPRPLQPVRPVVLPGESEDPTREPVRSDDAPPELRLAAFVPDRIWGSPTEPPARGPIRVGTAGMPELRRTRYVEPEYPLQARRIALEGEVVLDVLVDERGRVAGIEVLHGAPGRLTEAAVRAVEQWEYEPPRLGGRAVPVLVEVRIRFLLDGD